MSALNALLDKEGDQTIISNEELESQFQALRRLVASKAGFAAFTQLPKFRERLGVKVVQALKRNNDGVTYAAVDTICALMEASEISQYLINVDLNIIFSRVLYFDSSLCIMTMTLDRNR